MKRLHALKVIQNVLDAEKKKKKISQKTFQKKGIFTQRKKWFKGIANGKSSPFLMWNTK